MIKNCSFLDRRGLFSALLLLVLLKYQVHGAFTKSFGSPSHHSSLKTPDSQPISVQGRKDNAFHNNQNPNNKLPSSFHRTQQHGQTPLHGNANGANGANGATASIYSKKHKHVLAILTMPYTSMDRIANEAILHEALQHTNNLSIFLRCEGGNSPSLANLRRYMGEVYSQLWDFAMASDDKVCVNDVVVYPQNLPNTAPEQWVYHLPDLDAICSHDSLCGWISECASGRGSQFQFSLGNGVGGLDTHVEAVNADRLGRDLPPVKALHVPSWPIGASAVQMEKEHVVFVDDELSQQASLPAEECDVTSGQFLGGSRIPDKSLYNCVACGGTFDGMHYGHRKLLTLAVSSVAPITGRLMVGVTVDEMLQSKQYAEYIPTLEERMEGVRDFLHRLAPGMKNRIDIQPISDAYGPPGKASTGKEYDALVLSHETLANGVKLNQLRQEELGIEPLTLLVTRRTEAFGMSSTALRRIKSTSKVSNVLDRV